MGIGSNPLAKESWGLSNMLTSCALAAIAEAGGPRCCKRDSYKSINVLAIDVLSILDNISIDRFDSEKEYHLFYIFQPVIYSQLKRKLKRINLVKLIIFYHLCSYLCTQIYNQKGIFYVLIRIIQRIIL